jgi:hypothetical protein
VGDALKIMPCIVFSVNTYSTVMKIMHYKDWWFDSMPFFPTVFVHFYVLGFNEQHVVLSSFLALLTQPIAS